MRKSERFYLLNMLDYANEVRALTTRTTHEDYQADEILRAACAHWLQMIGEGASQLSKAFPAFQNDYQTIAWRRLIWMRNRIVHDYMGIDDETVWQTAVGDVPPLIEQLEDVLSELEDKRH